MKKLYKNEDFFQIIGHISVFFATLDFLVSTLLLEIVKEKGDKKLNLKSTLGQKLYYLKNLKENQVHNTSILKEINNFIDEAIEISNERNRYIHDQWIFSNEKIKIGQIERVRISKYKGTAVQFKKKREKFHITDLEKFLTKIGKMQKSMSRLIKNQKSN